MKSSHCFYRAFAGFIPLLLPRQQHQSTDCNSYYIQFIYLYLIRWFLSAVCCCQVVGGWLAEHIGGKILFGGGVLVTAGLTLLTPVAARWSVFMLIGLRVLEGVGEGVTFPSMHALLSRWIPPMERSRAVTFAYSGTQLGTVIGMSLSGVLCDHGFAGGWPSVFYVFGAAGCVWCFAWFLLCHNSPSEHPRISLAERQHIEKSMESSGTSVKPPVPWSRIAASPPFWACAIVQFANNWGFYTLLTCLPKYMRDVLQFDMSQNGILSALPYVATWIVLIGGGQLADWLRAPNRLTTTTVRKLFCVAGLLIPGLFLIMVGFLGCDRVLIVSAIVISIGSAGLAASGFAVNHLDLAPKYAGTLMGLTNTLGTVPGILGPQVVGALTYHASTRTQWQKVFYITTAIYAFSSAVFVVFGSGSLQDWAALPQAAADTRHNEGAGHNTAQGSRDPSKID